MKIQSNKTTKNNKSVISRSKPKKHLETIKSPSTTSQLIYVSEDNSYRHAFQEIENLKKVSEINGTKLEKEFLEYTALAETLDEYNNIKEYGLRHKIDTRGICTIDNQGLCGHFKGEITKEYLKHIDKTQVPGKVKKKRSSSEVNIAIERLVKAINTTIAFNKQRRSEIDFLRKERNLYDQVFRNIEYQILEQEKKILKNLQRKRDTNLHIKEAEESLNNLRKNIEKGSNNNLDNFFVEEESNYLQNIKSNADKSKNRGIVLKLNNNNSLSDSMVEGRGDKSLRENKMQEDANKQLQKQDNELRVEILENLLRDFKFKNEENDLELIMELYEKGESLNDTLYSEICILQEKVK